MGPQASDTLGVHPDIEGFLLPYSEGDELAQMQIIANWVSSGIGRIMGLDRVDHSGEIMAQSLTNTDAEFVDLCMDKPDEVAMFACAEFHQMFCAPDEMNSVAEWLHYANQD